MRRSLLETRWHAELLRTTCRLMRAEISQHRSPSMTFPPPQTEQTELNLGTSMPFPGPGMSPSFVGWLKNREVHDIALVHC
jgi:hypothetical protein